MRTSFRIAPLVAALAALMVTGNLSASYAANCERALQPLYKCSGTFSGGGSGDYCLRTDVGPPGDGEFLLVEDDAIGFRCTCEAKGRAPDVQFGASSRDFFCVAGWADTTLVGKAMGSRITGQGYSTAFFPGTRSTFTCQAVDSCP